jgi:hypothetical protein
VTKSKQGKKVLIFFWKRGIQMAAMHKRLMIIKPYFIRLPKNDQSLLKKKCQELLAHQYLQRKKKWYKII